VLLPDSTNKLLCKWQGPALVVDYKTPHSYLIESEGGQRRWLHANKLRPYHARINEVLVSKCAIVYVADADLGTIPVTGVAQDNNTLPSPRINPAKLAHLADEQKSQLLAVLNNFPDVFVEKPGLCTAVMHEINVTPEFKPKRLRT